MTLREIDNIFKNALKLKNQKETSISDSIDSGYIALLNDFDMRGFKTPSLEASKKLYKINHDPLNYAPYFVKAQGCSAN